MPALLYVLVLPTLVVCQMQVLHNQSVRCRYHIIQVRTPYQQSLTTLPLYLSLYSYCTVRQVRPRSSRAPCARKVRLQSSRELATWTVTSCSAICLHYCLDTGVNLYCAYTGGPDCAKDICFLHPGYLVPLCCCCAVLLSSITVTSSPELYARKVRAQSSRAPGSRM